MQIPRSIWRTPAVFLLVALLPLRAWAAEEPSAVYYRIFLTDGTSLASYGEFARVADRVVFSMPVGATAAAVTPALQLVSIPADKIDWKSTDEYAEAARAAHFSATRGEAEYQALSADVAGALNDIALTNSPVLKLQTAERARQRLAEWSRASYGYRARDVAQLSSMLDEVAGEIRSSMGQSPFSLQLVAMTAPPPAVPLLPAPSERESIQQAITVAGIVGDVGQRKSLLEAVVAALHAAGDADWTRPLRTRAVAELEGERRVDQAYASITRDALRRANARAAEADVHGVETVIADVLTRDDALGRRRSADIGALMATLDLRLDAARRLRLARDHWAMHLGEYREYRRGIRDAVATAKGLRGSLDDIRTLAGPTTEELQRRRLQADEAGLLLSRVKVPADLQPIHAMLVSAVKLAAAACEQRLEAVRSGNVQTAWNASSAAAGALMLLARAQEDLTRWLKTPSLP